MDFNYEEEKEKLLLANEKINEIIDRYNEILMSLSDKEKNIMLLHYGFKKLDTLRKMTPKGNYWDENRESKINDGLKKLQLIGNKTFPGVSDLDEIKYTVDTYMNNGNLSNIIRNFSSDIKNTYKKYSHYVYTILPIKGLKELEASKHRENQYLNSINNGVFATATMESIEKYIARANVGGMIVDHSEVRFPSNPFANISEEELTLINPVSIYFSNVDLFEPQFDCILDKNGNVHFIFGGEWIAPYEKVECIEKQAAYLPASFLEHNVVFYQENGEEKQLSIPLNQSKSL